MAIVTVTLACGHARRVHVEGTAKSKSAKLFAASLEKCANCRAEDAEQTQNENTGYDRMALDLSRWMA